ncbi:dihydroorotate dehydrogenase B (NAD(+)), catalytic subunit [archaeon]|nr:dihydroorotate dehydrogenase B (NAD(+)), catalytic subunit [archaeon]
MLDIELLGMELKNPLMLASGILGVSGASLKRVALSGGAGAIVTKSIGMTPREGHRNPTFVELDNGYLSAIGLANPGYVEFEEEIDVAKAGNVPIIASVYGFSFREYVEVGRVMEGYGADAIELNLSYPNVGKAGAFYGYSEELAHEVMEEVKKEVNLPVIAKLTAGAGDIVAIAKACEDAGADGITAIGSLRAMKIDIETGRPVLGNKMGGLSGSCIKPIAVRCVYEISREVSIPVIGCGGITTGEDAIEYFMAGANAVQIGTGLLSRGITIFKKVSLEIKEYMEENGYSGIDEIIGLAL